MRLRRGLLVLYGLVSLLVPVSTRTAPESNPGKLVLATGQEGGTYLRLGHALADVAREDGFEIEVRSSSGSVENIHSLIEGKAQIALVQSDIAIEPIIPIGVYRHGCLFLNPRDKDNLGHLEPEDHLLLIAYKNPEVA